MRLELDVQLVKSSKGHMSNLEQNAEAEINAIESLIKSNPSLQSFQPQLDAAKALLDDYSKITTLDHDVPRYIFQKQQELINLKKSLLEMGATWDLPTIEQVKAPESRQLRTAVELASKAMNLPARKSPTEVALELQRSQLDRTISRSPEEQAILDSLHRQSTPKLPH